MKVIIAILWVPMSGLTKAFGHFPVMKRTIIVAGIVVALAIAGVIFVSAPRTPLFRPFVTVTFLSYTNDAVGTRFALFTIVNNGNKTVRRLSFCHRESEVPSMYGYSHTVGSAVSLRPGESEVVRVVAPTHRTAWRQFFYVSQDGMRRRLSAALPRFARGRLVQDPLGEYVGSDWVNE